MKPFRLTHMGVQALLSTVSVIMSSNYVCMSNPSTDLAYSVLSKHGVCNCSVTASCKNGIFPSLINPSSYSSLVSRPYIEATLSEMVFAPSSVDICASGLVNAILAIGCRLATGTEKWQKASDPTRSCPQSWIYFQCALQCRNDVVNGPPSLLRLQESICFPLREVKLD